MIINKHWCIRKVREILVCVQENILSKEKRESLKKVRHERQLWIINYVINDT